LLVSNLQLQLLLILLNSGYQRVVGSDEAEATGSDLVDALLTKVFSSV